MSTYMIISFKNNNIYLDLQNFEYLILAYFTVLLCMAIINGYITAETQAQLKQLSNQCDASQNHEFKSCVMFSSDT